MIAGRRGSQRDCVSRLDVATGRLERRDCPASYSGLADEGQPPLGDCLGPDSNCCQNVRRSVGSTSSTGKCCLPPTMRWKSLRVGDLLREFGRITHEGHE